MGKEDSLSPRLLPPWGIIQKACPGAAKEEKPHLFPGMWEEAIGTAEGGNWLKTNFPPLLCSEGLSWDTCPTKAILKGKTTLDLDPTPAEADTHFPFSQ